MSTPTAEDWESLRPTIHDLYVRQNWKIGQIRDLLRLQKYHVNDRTIVTRIVRWDLQKNIRRGDILTALDLLAEIEGTSDGSNLKVSIRGRTFDFHQLALRLRQKGIPDPWQWRRTCSREGFEPSAHVRLADDTAQEVADGSIAETNLGSSGPDSGAAADTTDATGGSLGRQNELRSLLPTNNEFALQTLMRDARIPEVMHFDSYYELGEGIHHMRSYCRYYLQSRRSSFHVEPLVHQHTVHGQFGNHMQNGLSFFIKRQWDEAFSGFDRGCALIGPLFEDDHPMSLSLLLAVVCELSTHKADVIIKSVLAQASEMVREEKGKSVDLRELLKTLLKCPDYAWSASNYVRVCLDIFELYNLSHWKTLYVKERLCDCFYHASMFGVGSSTRSLLLSEQENFYGVNARNVLWTLTNVADDRLRAGNCREAVKLFNSAFDRARNIEGFGRAKIQFAAKEGLARSKFAEAVRCSQRVWNEQTERELSFMVQQAQKHVEDAIDIAITWFDPCSRRIARVLDLKSQVWNLPYSSLD